MILKSQFLKQHVSRSISNGHSLFKQEVDVFNVFADIRDALNADDPEGIENLLSDLDDVQNHISGKQGELRFTNSAYRINRHLNRQCFG